MNVTLIHRVLNVQSSTHHKRRPIKDHICYKIWLFCIHINSFWSKKCTRSLHENRSQGIPGVYLQDYGCISWWLNNLQIVWLRSMWKICIQIHLSLNIKKQIFTTPIRILLGIVVSKDKIKWWWKKIKWYFKSILRSSWGTLDITKN